MNKPVDKLVCGRFAPSPTGGLHFGSLTTALASYLDAKSENGLWWLRIEDIDSQRSRDCFSELIKQQLIDHGLIWDPWPGLPQENQGVVYQSQRNQIYSHFLHSVISCERTFVCSCTRKSLNEMNHSAEYLQSGEIRYPQICRNREITEFSRGKSLRIKSTNKDDFVMRRLITGDFSYSFAVIVDDYLQGVTNIVRGDDLEFTVERNRQIQVILGFPFPKIVHVPVVRDKRGLKLSKRNHEFKLRGGKFTKKQLSDSWAYLTKCMPVMWVDKVAETYETFFC